MGADAKVGFAKMDKDSDLEDRVGFQAYKFNFIPEEKSAK